MRPRINWHQRWAAGMLAGALAMDAVIGLCLAATEHVPAWHGVYCSTGLTTTDGCDVPFTHAASYILGTFAEVLMVPWWSGVFSFFAAGLIASHTDRRHDEMKQYVTEVHGAGRGEQGAQVPGDSR